MSTILLTLANSSTNPLPTLQREFEGVSDVLRDVVKQGAYRVVANPIATRDQIIKDLRVHEEDICLFSFSGHAGRDRLLLGDGVGNAEGIASLLGRCSQLKIVLLNGCSTAGQVEALRQKKIPVVIATSAPVGDEKAALFAITFFTELFQRHRPIREAFQRSIETVQVYENQPSGRHHFRGSIETEPEESPVWGLFVTQEHEADLDRPFRDLTTPRQNRREDITKLVGSNKIKEAFEKLRVEEAINQEVTMLSASFAKLERDERLSIISFDNARMQRAQIINALLELATQLD